MVVVPNISLLYEDDDIPGYESSWLLASSLRVLQGLADVYDLPVIVTASGCTTEHQDLVVSIW